MEIEKNQIFELVIEDEDTDEVFAISLVETPAIESNFVFFDKEEIQFAAINDEKRLLMGPILVPDKKILRMQGDNTPYFVFFKPETIKRLSEMYLQKKYTDKATLEHDKKLQGVSLVESWVVESREKDKSSLYGLNVPVGTWMGTFKVDNDEIWNDYVKTGEVKGFSIEGLFGHNLVQQTKYEFEADTILNDLEEQESILILSEIRALIKKDNRYKDNKRVDMESYSDYGDSVKSNAKRGIELNETNGNKCATPVGKVRAQQLAQGRPISIETIKRMYSYLSRAEVYYDAADSTSDCGYISFLLWGGKSALSYSRNKLKELGLLQESEQPSFPTAPSYAGEPAKGKNKYKSKALLEIQKPNVNVFGYHTRYFHMCPTASALFEHLTTMEVDEDTKGMIRSAAQAADNVFRKEEEIIKAGIASQHDYEEVLFLVDDFKDIMVEVDKIVGMEHDTSFMDNHIKVVKDIYEQQ